MRTLHAIYFLVIVLLLFSCGRRHTPTAALVPVQPQVYYSVDIESIVEDVLLDGLPEGINIADVNKLLLKNINNKLVSSGMKNDSQNIIKAKYDIVYFGHRLIGPPRAKYIIKYKLELLNKTTGNVLYSKNHEAYDTDLIDLINEISEEVLKHICGGCH